MSATTYFWFASTLSLNIPTLACNNSTSPTVNICTAYSLCFSTWHSRLGHPSADIRRIVLNLCKIPFSNKSVFDFCASCCLGKGHRPPSS